MGNLVIRHRFVIYIKTLSAILLSVHIKLLVSDKKLS